MFEKEVEIDGERIKIYLWYVDRYLQAHSAILDISVNLFLSGIRWVLRHLTLSQPVTTEVEP